jgi:hypothetical protein
MAGASRLPESTLGTPDTPRPSSPPDNREADRRCADDTGRGVSYALAERVERSTDSLDRGGNLGGGGGPADGPECFRLTFGAQEDAIAGDYG